MDIYPALPIRIRQLAEKEEVKSKDKNLEPTSYPHISHSLSQSNNYMK